MDANVKNVQVQQVTRFDPRGAPYKALSYSYFLGGNGPFVDEVPDDQNAQSAIEAAVAARVAHLRAVGALQ